MSTITKGIEKENVDFNKAKQVYCSLLDTRTYMWVEVKGAKEFENFPQEVKAFINGKLDELDAECKEWEQVLKNCK